MALGCERGRNVGVASSLAGQAEDGFLHLGCAGAIGEAADGNRHDHAGRGAAAPDNANLKAVAAPASQAMHDHLVDQRAQQRFFLGRGEQALLPQLRQSWPDVMQRCLSAGVDGYIVKDTSLQELIAAIKTLAEGSSYVDPRVAMLPVDALGFRRGAGALRTLLQDHGLADHPLFAQARQRGIRALQGHAESTDVTNDVNGGPSGVGVSFFETRGNRSRKT